MVKTQTFIASLEIAISIINSILMLTTAHFFVWPPPPTTAKSTNLRPSRIAGVFFLSIYLLVNTVQVTDMIAAFAPTPAIITPVRLLVAGTLQALSHGVWHWSRRTVGRQRLTMAFSRDEPVELISTGPYAYVRHPFYAAYLLSYAAAGTLGGRWRDWALWVLMYVQYQIAARFEERKFARSALGGVYERSMARKGRFLLGEF